MTYSEAREAKEEIKKALEQRRAVKQALLDIEGAVAILPRGAYGRSSFAFTRDSFGDRACAIRSSLIGSMLSDLDARTATIKEADVPNHCEQDLYVSGPRADVDALMEFVREDGDGPHAGAFSANKIIAYPKEYADADAALCKAEKARVPYDDRPKDGFNHGGYEWCREHWGSKWGAYDSEVERTVEGATFHFTSAWSPIKPVIEALSQRFPTLTLRLDFFEGGMGFSGTTEWKAGKVVREEEDSKYAGGRGG